MISARGVAVLATAPRMSAPRQAPLARPALAPLAAASPRVSTAASLAASPTAGTLAAPLLPRRAPRRVPAAAAAAAAEPKGAKLDKVAIAVAAGLALRFAVPVPAGLTAQAWSALAIFAATIFGLVLEPLPVGAWAFCCLTVALATKTLSLQAGFAAFTNPVIWLIVCSFFFAAGFQKTGLGSRVANLFVKYFGKSTLGLAYGLCAADALVSPAMPSTSARAGGIFMPIVSSLAQASGSKPNDPSRTKMGTFLVSSLLHTSNHSSNLFLTSAAQNLLCLNLAAGLGAPVAGAFMAWFAASCVPALVGIAVTPLLCYKLTPPELKDTPEAPRMAEERLKEMGPMSGDEKIMLSVMGVAVSLWMFGDALGVAPVTAAMIGLSALLVTGVLSWKECLAYGPAWDTLTWFAVLIGMSSALNDMGVIATFANAVSSSLATMGLGPLQLCALLNVAYYYSHYLFASQTAHVGALYAAFMAIMLSSGVPGVAAALSLAFTTNVFGSMTHYASGQSAIYFGAGYIKLEELMRDGALFGPLFLGIWIVIGGLWWKALGLI